MNKYIIGMEIEAENWEHAKDKLCDKLNEGDFTPSDFILVEEEQS